MINFGQRLRQFREVHGYSQKALAERLGIGPFKVFRWENGTSKPSTEIADILRTLGFGEIKLEETKAVSTPRSQVTALNGHSLRKLAVSEITLNGQQFSFQPSPYVTNGPSDQVELFEHFYGLQSTDNGKCDARVFARRLSALSHVSGLNIDTAQHQLENPLPTSKHWNPNYGTHGFHRYVGRFPPHLVRTLLNHFGANTSHTVCDPFCGSGTTLVEARMLGISGIGIDICPLSCLISRTKTQFPTDTSKLEKLLVSFQETYTKKWKSFLNGRSSDDISHDEILARPGNSIPTFVNHERWMSPSAFLGCSITVEFVEKLKGYAQDFFSCALSSRMRSIGNLDVDVVRAEYSKIPRTNVDVLDNVTKAAKKMITAIGRTLSTHKDLIGSASDIQIIEGDLLSASLAPGSVDFIITSPPYGVEAMSYLRTHLLSYRVLHPILRHDPYESSEKIIGSEYLDRNRNPSERDWSAAKVSPEFKSFFSRDSQEIWTPKIQPRTLMMGQFFDQLLQVAQQYYKWLSPNGKVAFVIGNKRLGDLVIPTDRIAVEIFRASGFDLDREIKHKLKCSNTNSEVPWQERTIQDEYVLLMSKRSNA